MSGRARANGEGSIYPHRNGFAAYVWVTKPDGTRDRKYVYAKTREDVHAKWIKLQGEAQRGPVATSTPTVAQHMTRWLEDVIRPNRAPLTYSTYETFIRLYVNPILGPKKLDRLQARDVQSWINTVGKTCQCCAQGKDRSRAAAKQRCCAVGKCCNGVLSNRSLTDIRGVLRAALNHAKDVDEVISRNVAEGVKLPQVRSKRGKAWSSEEARRFLESARTEGDPLYAAYVLVLVLGLRKGEVLGHDWTSVEWGGWDGPCRDHSATFCPACRDEFDVGLVVEYQIQRVGRQLLRRETKTPGSDDTLPIPSICAAALRLRLAEYEDAKTKADDEWIGEGLVFCTKYGTPIEPRNFSRSWDRRCEKAGVRRITVHDARRTCGTLLADLDIHPRVAMQILRHAQFSITMEIYTQVSSEKTRAALRKLGESLNG